MIKKTKTVKKAANKVASQKKQVKKAKPTPFKSKLGHDPLSWLNGEDAQEMGISFNDIKSDKDQLEKVLPEISSNDSEEQATAELAPEIVQVIETDVQQESLADQSWGLFDDDDDISTAVTIETKAEVISDDGTWGLFGNDEPESPGLPVGEGIAWGLFASDITEDSTVDGSAQIIHLPSVFNVASMDKLYHEFERLINEEHDVIVDASEIEIIDACGLQLLYASHKELQKRSCKLVMKDASEKIGLLSRASFINEILGING